MREVLQTCKPLKVFSNHVQWPRNLDTYGKSFLHDNDLPHVAVIRYH